MCKEKNTEVELQRKKILVTCGKKERKYSKSNGKAWASVNDITYVDTRKILPLCHLDKLRLYLFFPCLNTLRLKLSTQFCHLVLTLDSTFYPQPGLCMLFGHCPCQVSDYMTTDHNPVMQHTVAFHYFYFSRKESFMWLYHTTVVCCFFHIFCAMSKRDITQQYCILRFTF